MSCKFSQGCYKPFLPQLCLPIAQSTQKASIPLHGLHPKTPLGAAQGLFEGKEQYMVLCNFKHCSCGYCRTTLQSKGNEIWQQTLPTGWCHRTCRGGRDPSGPLSTAPGPVQDTPSHTLCLRALTQLPETPWAQNSTGQTAAMCQISFTSAVTQSWLQSTQTEPVQSCWDNYFAKELSF